MPNSPTTNMALITPIVSSPGTDPGPTYATEINTAFGQVDIHDHTGPGAGRGKLITTAALNINADLTFGGFSLLNGNNINGVNGNFTNLGATTLTGTITGGSQNVTGLGAVSCSSLTVSGTFSAASLASTTGSITAGTSLANTIAIAGSATTVNPTITVAGDATRSLAIKMPVAASTIGGLLISPTGGNPLLLGNFGASNQPAIWLGFSDSTAATSNWSVSQSGGTTFVNAVTNVSILIGSSNFILQATAASLLVGAPIVENTPATSLTLKGNAATTGGTAVTLDNQTTQTSGTILNIATGGTQKAFVGFDGSINSLAGKFTSSGTSTGAIVSGSAAAAGVAVTLTNGVDVGATGYIAELVSAGNQFAISGRGHLIPLSTAPTAPVSGAFAGGYTATAAVTAISINGSDAAFQLKFTVNGVPTSIPANSVLVTISLAQAYQSTSVVGMACYGKAANGASDIVGLSVVQNGVGTIQILNTTTFTPVTATSYVFNVMTMAAGATS